MNLKRYLTPIIFSHFLSANLAFGQIELHAEFQAKLALAQIEFFQPVENQFKNMGVQKNSIQNYDLVVYHKQEKVEVRYLVEPLTNSPWDEVPHINFTRKAISAALNHEESHLSVFQLPQDKIKTSFEADWGAQAFFQPKESFSKKKHCKLVALHAREKGYVYIYYLFDNAETDIDDRFNLVRFITNDKETE